jgi:hypothetical protein
MSEWVKEGLSAWAERSHRYRFRVLLASLLLLLAAVPLTVASPSFDLVFGIAVTLVVLSGLLAMQCERLLLLLAALLGVSALLARWIAILFPSAETALATTLVPFFFFAFFVVFLLRAVVTAEEVTSDVIGGALSVYLLLGLTWSLLYQSIALVDPAAFSVGAAIADSGPLTLMDFLYYSFITLATVGYGDITPVAPAAQSFAAAEAVIGVLYVAVLVARLVSAYRR